MDAPHAITLRKEFRICVCNNLYLKLLQRHQPPTHLVAQAVAVLPTPNGNIDWDRNIVWRPRQRIAKYFDVAFF